MTKLKNPLLSLEAIGRLAKDLAFRRSRKQNIVETTPIPEDAKSLAQLSWRHMYQKAVALWHALSGPEKQEWESLARRKHMTGFAWFISQALKPNPGLYLPLQGGTMTGDIDMAKHRLLKLPSPTDSQEPATKAYHDANIYSDAEADARIAIHAAIATAHQNAPGLIATHAAIAAAHHARYTNAEALAAAIAGGLIKYVWKDSFTRVLNDLNRTSSIGWTDLDLTAATSPNAKIAILRCYFYIDSYTNGRIVMSTRKNGTDMDAQTVEAHNPYPGHYTYAVGPCGIDTNQILEYTIVLTGTAQIDTVIQVIGYIE